MKSFLATILFALTWVSALATGDTRAAPEEYRTFFLRKGPIMAREVHARFGAPDRYAPLFIGGKKEDATPETSWWVYELKNSVVITVGVDKGTVQAVMRQNGSHFAGLLYQRWEHADKKRGG